MNKKQPFYITTPIYYPSGHMHIGHSYCTVLADTIARYKKARGFDVLFITGTDEHGQKIERIAKQNNMNPKEYVDEIVKDTKELWSLFNIDYDIFIRTTDAKHIVAVQRIFNKLYEQGDIYKGEYSGLYCTPCETFFTERQLHEGNCPDCGRDVEVTKEESYFFRLSAYRDRILEYMESNEGFLIPGTRKNEMINNFLKQGLEDLAVTRTSVDWGIEVSFDPKHKIYVWIDALSNYISALGYLSDDDSIYKKYWPCDLHLVGKEIVRFHAIIWPAILMALGEELPKTVCGHGWLIIDGNKMSKSRGNVIDPAVLVKRYTTDAVRYFLLRELSFGKDGNFTNEALIKRINSDLANDLGNLVSRTTGMIIKYFNYTLIDARERTEFDEDLIRLAINTSLKVEEHMDILAFNDALIAIWDLITKTNKYADLNEPWMLVKDASKKARLAQVLHVMCEVIRIVSILIEPFMPNTPTQIYEQLNIERGEKTDWDAAKIFFMLPHTIKVSKSSVLFPRIDMEKELVELAHIQQDKDILKDELISIEDFSKLSLRIGFIKEAQEIKKSKKLLRLKVDIGTQERQIVSGIALKYSPDELVGKRVIVLLNLMPVKLCGELSEGMILAASDGDELALLTVDKDIKYGAKVR